MKKTTLALSRAGLTMDYDGFREFLEAEQRKLEESRGSGVSIRYFAKFLGTSHTTIEYYLERGILKDRVPSLAMLEQIAEKTNTPLWNMLQVVFPDMRDKSAIKDLTALEVKLVQAFRDGDAKTLLSLTGQRIARMMQELRAKFENGDPTTDAIDGTWVRNLPDNG